MPKTPRPVSEQRRDLRLRQLLNQLPPSMPDDPEARQHLALFAGQMVAELTTIYASIREQAVRDLYDQHGTWAKVGEIIGTSGQNAFKLATRND